MPTTSLVRARIVQKFAQAECLDHIIIFNEHLLRAVLTEYVDYLTVRRRTKGSGRQTPVGGTAATATGEGIGLLVLGGQHRNYRRAVARTATVANAVVAKAGARLRRRCDLERFDTHFACGDSTEDEAMLALARQAHYRWIELKAEKSWYGRDLAHAGLRREPPRAQAGSSIPAPNHVARHSDAAGRRDDSRVGTRGS